MARWVNFNHYISVHKSVSVGDWVMVQDHETRQYEYGPHKVLKIKRLDRDHLPKRYFVEIATSPWHVEGEGQLWDISQVEVIKDTRITWENEVLD